MAILAAFLGWMFDGMEMGIFPLVARPALQEMQAASGVLGEQFVQTWMGRITAVFLLGAALGGLVFGWLGDRVGRVRAMTFSILTYSVFSGLCYFAVEPWHLGLCRFIAALGMGGEWALGVALVMECWPTDKRPIMASLIGAAANAGYALIALVGIFFGITRDSWRWVMLIGAAPALLVFIIRLFVPESERWQASVRAGPNHPLRDILRPPLLRSTLLAILFASVPLVVTWGIIQWIPTWGDQMTHGQQPKAKAYLQLVASLGAVVGSFLAPLLGRWLGRRQVYCGLCVCALGSCLLLFNGIHHYDTWLLATVALVGLCTASFYGWLPQYLPELFPTRVRATGQGLAFNFGRILAAVGAWQMGPLLGFFDNSYARAGGTIALTYLIGMVAIWFGPETRDQPLPD